MKKEVLKLSHACWDELSSAQKADVAARYEVTIISYSEVV